MDHPVTSARNSDGIVNSLTDIHEPGRELVSGERVWGGPILAVDTDQARLGSGQEPMACQVVIHHDAIAIVALREGDTSSQPGGAVEILMIRQYRHPVRVCLWGIPAGLLDVAGEEPAVAAARKLTKEVDYEAIAWFTLAEFCALPGFTTEGVRIFPAQDLSLLSEDRRTVREDEEAEFVPTWVRLGEAPDATMGGRLHNPSTVLGILATAQARTRGWSGLRPADAPWLRSPESL